MALTIRMCQQNDVQYVTDQVYGMSCVFSFPFAVDRARENNILCFSNSFRGLHEMRMFGHSVCSFLCRRPSEGNQICTNHIHRR